MKSLEDMLAAMGNAERKAREAEAEIATNKAEFRKLFEEWYRALPAEYRDLVRPPHTCPPPCSCPES